MCLHISFFNKPYIQLKINFLPCLTYTRSVDVRNLYRSRAQKLFCKRGLTFREIAMLTSMTRVGLTASKWGSKAVSSLSIDCDSLEFSNMNCDMPFAQPLTTGTPGHFFAKATVFFNSFAFS